jgi:hypothetical protein
MTRGGNHEHDVHAEATVTTTETAPKPDAVQPAAAETKKATRAPVDIAIAVLTLLTICITVVTAVVSFLGWTTRATTGIGAAAAVATALTAGLIPARKVLKDLPAWMFLVAPVLIGGVVVYAYFARDVTAGITRSGDITTKTTRADVPLSVTAGSRYVVMVTESNGLKAQLTLHHGAVRLYANPFGDDGLRIDQTLTGGIWTATVVGLDQSTGHWELNAISDAPERVHVGDTLDNEQLVDENDSNGYVLHLDRPEKLFISVAPVDPADMKLTVQVIKANGFLATPVRASGVKREAFGPFTAGTYVITVAATDHDSGSFSLSVGGRAPASTPSFTVPLSGTDVAVPHVVGQTEAQGDAALLAAGLAPRPIPVCSHSVPAGIVRQVVRVVGTQETIIDDLDGVHAGNATLPANTSLIVKVGNGQPCT